MLDVLLLIVVSLFILKLVWNSSLPLMVEWSRWEREARHGISLMPFVEVSLLVVAVLLSWVSDGERWLHDPSKIVVGGLMAIVGSYALMIGLAVARGWIWAPSVAREAAAEIVVLLDHPHGRIEVPLEVWIEHGPGRRSRLRPVAARDAESGLELPLRVIPLRYRNSTLSRILTRVGLMKRPWA